MIIFDENVEEYWINLFKNKRYPVFSIRDNFPGISDKEVIDVVRDKNGILVTEDKDFGELLFSHRIESVSVILMRYDQPFYDQIEDYLLKCIDNYLANPEMCFITISRSKIRYRKM